MDPISDFFTRIKNGYRARKTTVVVPHSGPKAEIARLLAGRGYLEAVEKKGRKVRKFLELKLRYRGAVPALTGVTLISKPSRRIYLKRSEIRLPRQGFGTLIVSTSQGFMTGQEAKKAGVGGEAIAEVW